MTTAVIVDVVRTAVGKGKPGGALSGTHPVELLAHVLREIVQRNGIDPAQVDTVGSDVNLYVGSTSFLAQEVTRQLGARAAALMLDGSEGEDLDRYAWDRYQLLRKDAAAAVVPVRYFRATTAGGSGSVPKDRSLLSLGGIEYVTATGATFGATTTTQPATARAAKAGKAFQVGRNQLRRFRDAPFDPSLEVTNDVPAAGGEDREDDDAFRERVRAFWLAARRGTLGAIEFGALTVPGVVSASAVESIDASVRPARIVTLYVADGSGVSNEALAARVREVLFEWRAAGIFVLVSSSVPSIVPVVLRLRFAANAQGTAALAETVRAAVFEFVNSLPVNATLLQGDLFAVLRRFASSGLFADQGSVVEPAGDVVPAPGTTLRTTLSDVSLV